MIRTAALAALALIALTAPAAAQTATSRAAMNAQAVAQGPGGCVTFNAALDAAIATQLRTGKQAEARRLAGLRQPCGARG